MIKSAFKKISENEAKELETHFIYAGNYHMNDFFVGNLFEDKLKSFIVDEMIKYNLKSVLLTRIFMSRGSLETQRYVDRSVNGGFSARKDSVNDDLETLFEEIRLGKSFDTNSLNEVNTYFYPKLTEEELELFQKKDPSFLETLQLGNDDFHLKEMLKKMAGSESDYTYVNGFGYRRTRPILFKY